MMNEIKIIFDLYYSWSGQMVNFAKSSILFSANMDLMERQHLSDILKVNIMDDKAVYLGNPLFQHRRVSNTYKYLENKVEKRIGGWKCQLLSHAGREVLIKSSLASIPIYHMGSTPIPAKNIQSMEKRMRDFFWGFKDGQRHLYLRAWDFLKLPKINGGLGFRDLKMANLSMIASNAWRFLSNPISIWTKILKAKYFPTSSVWEVQFRSPASPFWRGFMMVRDFLFLHSRWLVANGTNIDIFEDKWVANRDELIVRPVDWEGSSRVMVLLLPWGEWNTSLIMAKFDQNTAVQILNTPINKFEDGGKDTLIWLPSSSGMFSAKNFYKTLQNLMIIEALRISLPTNTLMAIWKRNDLLPRVKSFVWRCLVDALPTNARRAASIPNANNLCVLCNGNEESLEHLFFDCYLSKEIWKAVDFSVDRLGNGTFADIVSLWMNQSKDESAKAIYTIWSIWKSRCDKVFRGTPINASHVAAMVVHFMDGYSHESVVTGSVREHSVPCCWPGHDSSELVVNVDAAVRESSSVWGIICRTNDGLVSFVATGVCDVSDALIAEGVGILEAIKISCSLRPMKTHIYSDAQVITNAISNEASIIPWKIRHIAFECRALLKSNNHISLSYLKRDCNVAANILASNAYVHQLFGNWTFGEIPLVLSNSMCISPSGICLK